MWFGSHRLFHWLLSDWFLAHLSFPQQQPERKRQRPPTVGGGVGLGPDQQERLHGFPLLRDLGAAETRRGRMVRCGEEEETRWKRTETAFFFPDPNAALRFIWWDLGSSCCPRRRENTLTFLSNQRARRATRSCDRSLRFVIFFPRQVDEKVFLLHKHLRSYYRNHGFIPICFFFLLLFSLSGRGWDQGSPQTPPPPLPRCASTTATATRTVSSSRISTSSWSSGRAASARCVAR